MDRLQSVLNAAARLVYNKYHAAPARLALAARSISVWPFLFRSFAAVTMTAPEVLNTSRDLQWADDDISRCLAD